MDYFQVFTHFWDGILQRATERGIFILAAIINTIITFTIFLGG